VANLSPQTATGPISITPDLGAPAESAPALSAPASPVAPLAAGPVHMPPAVTSTQTAPKPERAHGAIYTVKITDSYKKIAQAHHITVAELKEANHIKGNVLHTGQKLIIPSGKTDAAETANIPASTPAQAVNTSLTGTDMSEPTAVPAATTSLAETPHAHVYTVVKGDTLVKIAHRFKTTTTALMEENNISDPTKLAIGKKLKIPSRESRSARNVTPPSTTQPSQVQAKETTPTEENTPSGQLANFVP
jgi:LysM repeat protein